MRYILLHNSLDLPSGGGKTPQNPQNSIVHCTYNSNKLQYVLLKILLCPQMRINICEQQGKTGKSHAYEDRRV